MRRAVALLLSCLYYALFAPTLVKADADVTKTHEAWSSTLEAEFERLRTTLPTMDYEAASALLQEAKTRVGPRPATLLYPQDKIDHMVVLFVENRASDHIWGCTLSLADIFAFSQHSSHHTNLKSRCGAGACWAIAPASTASLPTRVQLRTM